LFSSSGFLLGIILLFVLFNRKLILTYDYRINTWQSLAFLLVSALLFTFYFLLKYVLPSTRQYLMLYISLPVYLAGMLFLAVAIFGQELFRKTANTLVASLIMVYVYFVLTLAAWDYWHRAASLVGKIVYSLLKMFDSSAGIVLGTEMQGPVLSLGNFSVAVGSPCSGLESLSMFIALFLMLVVYEQKNLDPKKAGIVFLVGLLGTYLLNVIRLSLLMVIGTRYPAFAAGQFHSQAGWVLFSIFILLLLYFGYGWMKK